MAVELKVLYEEAKKKYGIELQTQSCFDKMINWIHIVEETELVPFLRGNELVLNSGFHYASDEWLLDFITRLCEKEVGGLIIAPKAGERFSEEIVAYCDRIHLPLFSASWNTPYVDVMRTFSEILLKNEQKETNLVTAFKNAIYYPHNEDVYVKAFESNGFFQGISYTTIVLSCHTYSTENGNAYLQKIEEHLRSLLKHSAIYYEKNDVLIVLAAGYDGKWLGEKICKLCEEDENLYAGVGNTVNRIEQIHRSYETAYTAYQLTKTAIPKNFLAYEKLGVYQILTDVKEKEIYPAFVREVLGDLIDYDKENQTEYVRILETYFENECNTLWAADALYCHKNTLAYKMNKIKELLGYDILSNENRTRIMLAFYIMRMGGYENE